MQTFTQRCRPFITMSAHRIPVLLDCLDGRVSLLQLGRQIGTETKVEETVVPSAPS